MTHDLRKLSLTVMLGGFFLATSHDARSGQAMAGHEGPVCSEQPSVDSTARMKAFQSLRETQVEIDLLKQHQGAAGKH